MVKNTTLRTRSIFDINGKKFIFTGCWYSFMTVAFDIKNFKRYVVRIIPKRTNVILRAPSDA
jgi:hypothetical protein